MIELCRVNKIYEQKDIKTEILKAVDLSIADGEFVCVHGKSGCGKTTLLNILGLLDDFSNGSYLLNGTEVSSLGRKQKTRLRATQIGFIFQAFHLIPLLTVEENIEVPMGYAGMPRESRKKKVTELIDKMGLIERKDYLTSRLSGGEKQRVAIARALALEPSLILADEPTGNLDSKNGEIIMELLKEMNEKGKTIIMVTHDQSLAKYGSRIITMEDGKIK